jgi:hypothetical protein
VYAQNAGHTIKKINQASTAVDDHNTERNIRANPMNSDIRVLDGASRICAKAATIASGKLVTDIVRAVIKQYLFIAMDTNDPYATDTLIPLCIFFPFLKKLQNVIKLSAIKK